MYTMYSNTTAKEGGTGSMAVEDSVLQRTPQRGNEQLIFFQPVEGKVWHWCGQSTGDERLARAAVKSGSRRRPPCRGLRRGYQWATTNTQLEESRSSRFARSKLRRGTADDGSGSPNRDRTDKDWGCKEWLSSKVTTAFEINQNPRPFARRHQNCTGS